MSNLIEPKILKGFRDFLPEQEIPRKVLMEKLEEVFRLYGFVPIDTPVLEYSEILLRKSNGETEKQVYRFQDNGGRDIALRFDLTVPFARFVAEHKEELAMPFKRYHMAKVWRGEKPQAGRYREFIQCDFDTVGTDSAAADFEILSVMKDSLNALGVSGVTVHLSHRGIFNRFLEKLGIREKSEDILRTVDKLGKTGEEEVLRLLSEITGKPNALEIMEYIKGKDSFEETLALMEEKSGGESPDSVRLKEIYSMLKNSGIEDSFILDPSITRGLDYYTGIVYETFLNDLPGIGSVCSGGRYDNLTGLYMKEKLPGVGSSIGLDRLIAGLEELKLIKKAGSFTKAAIFCQNPNLMCEYQKIAAELRKNGISTEVFPEEKKMGQQYTWAEKKGIPFGILLSGDGLSLKNLKTRDTKEGCSLEEVIKALKEQD